MLARPAASALHGAILVPGCPRSASTFLLPFLFLAARLGIPVPGPARPRCPRGCCVLASSGSHPGVPVNCFHVPSWLGHEAVNLEVRGSMSRLPLCPLAALTSLRKPTSLCTGCPLRVLVCVATLPCRVDVSSPSWPRFSESSVLRYAPPGLGRSGHPAVAPSWLRSD